MKKMKMILAIAAVSILALSCENAKFLERAPYSSTAPENFFKTPTQLKLSLISCYETINTSSVPGVGVSNGTYASGLFFLMNGPADDVISNGTTTTEGLEMECGIFDQSSQTVRNFWKAFFAGINRCNVVLRYVDSVEDLSEESATQYKAEARFLRAFFYYHLAWGFGGVPLITSDISDGQEPRASLKEVYELILSDLEYAYQNLQDTKSGIIGTGSANKWTAAAYLGRVCNYLAACKRYGTGSAFVSQQPLNDFSFVDEAAMTAKAKNALEDVCLNSPYFLNADFRVNFLELSKEMQYNECLFLSENYVVGTSGYFSCSSWPTPASYSSGDANGGSNRHMPTPTVFYSYVKQDARRDWTCTGRYNEGYKVIKIDGHNYPAPCVQDSTTINGVKSPYPYYDNPDQIWNPTSSYKCCTGKFRNALLTDDLIQHPIQRTSLSYPLMRLADVYLMYAEALYFSGNENEARAWMNKVVARIATDEDNYNFLIETYHKDDFIDELIASRERELFMECSHKFDLIRFNRIDAAIAAIETTYVTGEYIDPAVLAKKYKLSSSAQSVLYQTLKDYWQPYKIWLPISEEQIGVNPNLVQNAGWSGSGKVSE